MTQYRKALSPYSPMRTPKGIHPALRDLVAQPLQILLVPEGIDDESGELILPRLEIICDLNKIFDRDGYRSTYFDIPVALAGDLLLLREARGAAPGILWPEAHAAAYGAVKTISCSVCRNVLSAGFPSLAELGTDQCFVHGDLHFANVVQSTIGLHVVDHENLHSAPAYTDIVGFLLECTRALKGDVTPIVDDCLAACSYLSRRFGREIQLLDIAYATGLALHRADLSGFPLPGIAPVLCSLVGRLQGDRELPHKHLLIQ